MEESQLLYFYFVGGVIVLGAGIWMLILAFRSSIWWGIGVLLLAPVVGLIFLVTHWKDARWPFLISFLGGLFLAFPPGYGLYHRLQPIDLGPLERMVDGEMHITLTGWDQDDYSVLKDKKDVVVLQMANADVTDDTLKFLKGMNNLKKLDLSHTKITDNGLKYLKGLPSLEFLYLKNTAITVDGFKEYLMPMTTLRGLDLTGTAVSRETSQEWKKAKSGRVVLQ